MAVANPTSHPAIPVGSSTAPKVNATSSAIPISYRSTPPAAAPMPVATRPVYGASPNGPSSSPSQPSDPALTGGLFGSGGGSFSFSPDGSSKLTVGSNEQGGASYSSASPGFGFTTIALTIGGLAALFMAAKAGVKGIALVVGGGVVAAYLWFKNRSDNAERELLNNAYETLGQESAISAQALVAQSAQANKAREEEYAASQSYVPGASASYSKAGSSGGNLGAQIGSQIGNSIVPGAGAVTGMIGSKVYGSADSIVSGRGSTEDYINLISPLGSGTINEGIADAVDWVGDLF